VNADQGNSDGEDCSGLALGQDIPQDRLSFAISEILRIAMFDIENRGGVFCVISEIVVKSFV
jgi:hypothetical protein